MRLIDADALKERIEFVVENNTNLLTSSVVRNAMLKLVDMAKTIEAEPVRRGRWLPHPTEKDWRVCSACGQGTEIVRHEAGATTEYSYKHCPWCGAKLEVEND